MSRNTIAFLLVPLLACGQAQAAESVFFGLTTDRTTDIFLDVPSIHGADGLRHAWSKIVHPPHSKESRVDGSRWRSAMHTQVAYDCAQHTNRFEALVNDDEDGTSESLPVGGCAPPWQEPSARGAGGAMMEYIGTWKPT